MARPDPAGADLLGQWQRCGAVRTDIVDLDPPPQLIRREPLGLLGDAAHAMAPDPGQASSLLIRGLAPMLDWAPSAPMEADEVARDA